MLRVRPYHLIEVVSAMGGDRKARRNLFIRTLMDAIRKDPDRPLMLVCNADEIWGYQDPGRGSDTPESPEFNQKRDLEILYRINLFPGAILPARILFHRLWDQIENLEGLCVFSSETAPAWAGWPRTRVAAYGGGGNEGWRLSFGPAPWRNCGGKSAFP